MPSPVRTVRRAIELALRIGAMGVLLWALWLAARPVLAPVTSERVAQPRLAERLRAWTAAPAPESIRVALDSLPDDSLVDWLVAVRRGGSAVAWMGDIAPVALAIEPVNAPSGGARLLVAAPPGSELALRDAAGPLDSVRTTGAGAVLRAPTLAEPASADRGGSIARARLRDSLVPGRVLVLATAGWEARYLTAALEEEGWRVDARLTIAPNLFVRRGNPGAIDTGRYAAVIALDSAAAGDARRIAAFAQSGGGVILSGIAAASASLRAPAPGVPGPRARPASASFTAAAPRRALSFIAIERVKPDAIVLEAREGRPVVAARRVGLGRVLQVGYDETWRWRMQGGAPAPAAHRRWWSDAVAAIARRQSVPRESSGIAERTAAPRAAVVAALGPPVDGAEARVGGASSRTLRPWMLVLALALLLAEWASRRFRGAA